MAKLLSPTTLIILPSGASAFGMGHSSTNLVIDPSQIAGNVSDKVKRSLGDIGGLLNRSIQPGSTVFGESIGRRFKVTEISVNSKVDEPRKMEARYVVEVDVTQDMLNGGASMHGGCSAFLVDLCTTFAIHALHMSGTNVDDEDIRTVSQSLNIVYHAPAVLGEKLRIISTTMTLGSRTLTARAEIWSADNHRLVVSGTHVKMIPSLNAKM